MIDKNLLKDGDLILFHTKGFSLMSMAIRELTQSYWNHVGMYCEGFVIEAEGNGVVKTPIEEYLDERTDILRVVRIREEAFKDIEEYRQGLITAIIRMKEKIGAKYDWWAIVWLGFKYIFKGSYKKTRQFIPIGNPLQSRDKFFCSEVICESCYKISSINPYLFLGDTRQTCDTTTPKDCGKTKNVGYVCGENKQ